MAGRTYDLVVIGGGSAGSTAAKKAAKDGRRVALVERDLLGGTCLNYGCDPTKALLHTAHLLYQARNASPYGIRIPRAELDWNRARARVREVVESIRGGSHEEAIARQQERDIDVYLGDGRFEDPHTVRAGEAMIRGERVLIATGSSAMVPPIDGLEAAGYITNRDAVWLDQLPASVAVLGAGPVGVEFAQMFARFGASVTLVEMTPAILPADDTELSGLLTHYLRQEGITVELGATVERVERHEGRRRLCWQRDSCEQWCEADTVLLAAGRTPNVDGLDLEAAGIEASDGHIDVDETLRTSQPHVWAAGDVLGAYPFTHVASRQGRLACQNSFDDSPEPFDYAAVPWVTYTHPALAHVGRTEDALREQGVDYEVETLSFDDITRSRVTGETKGMVKVLSAPDGTLLGGHILGERADDLIAPLVLAMRHGLPVGALADTIFPYPTRSEALAYAASSF